MISEIFIPVVFAGFWTGGAWLSSFFSGWGRLSKKYQDYDSPQDQWKGWQTVRFGFIDYKSSIWLSADRRGLHLKTGPLFFFRLFHPPLCIPWSAINKVEQRNIFVFKMTSLKVDNASLQFSSGSLESALPYLRDKLIDSNLQIDR